jgi:hypothetical protein
MVNWQDPETRLYHHVARLTRDQDGSYEFAYLPTASKLAGFRPFVGFLISGQTYRSPSSLLTFH